MSRFAEPEDISAVVLFLATDAAPHVTGATIDVNGGYVMACAHEHLSEAGPLLDGLKRTLRELRSV